MRVVTGGMYMSIPRLRARQLSRRAGMYMSTYVKSTERRHSSHCTRTWCGSMHGDPNAGNSRVARIQCRSRSLLVVDSGPLCCGSSPYNRKFLTPGGPLAQRAGTLVNRRRQRQHAQREGDDDGRQQPDHLASRRQRVIRGQLRRSTQLIGCRVRRRLLPLIRRQLSVLK